MEGSLSTFGGPSWGADSTSPQPPETRTRVPVQTPASPENTLLDDRRLQVNSIRGTRWLWLKFFSFFFPLKIKEKYPYIIFLLSSTNSILLVIYRE